MSRTRNQQFGHLVGVSVVAACLAWFFLFDKESKLELNLFDLRVKYFSSIPAQASIVHVDIDDNSLDRVGRWPWHRDQLAELIAVIEDLQPGHILIDFLLSEYESPPIRDRRYGPDSDIDPEVRTIGAISDENVVFGDWELAESIRRASDVFLAAHFDLAQKGKTADLIRRIEAIHVRDGRLTLPQMIGELGVKDSPAMLDFVNREMLRLRMRDALVEDFTASEVELAAKVNVSVDQVSVVFAGVKRAAAELLTARYFGESRSPKLEDVRRGILGEAADRQNEDQQDVNRAYRHHLGLAIAEKSLIPMPDGAAPAIPVSVRMTPPHFLLGEAARGIGAVNFVADPDGIVRRVPLLIRVDDRAVLHLGFAAACHILGRDPNQCRIEGRTLILPGSPPLHIPLDDQGNMFIPWTKDARIEHRQGGFPHISAAKLWSIVSARREMEENKKALHYALADIVALVKGEVKRISPDGAAESSMATDHAYRLRVNEWLALKRKAHLARLRRAEPEQELLAMENRAAGLLAQIERDQDLAISMVEQAAEEMDELSAEELENDPLLKEDAAKYGDARDVIRRELPRYHKANEILAEKIRRGMEDLAELKGKHIVLGFAATATGDIVSTPINSITNGPVCHAQVMNGILENQFLTNLAWPLEVMICTVLGVTVVFMTMTRGPSVALFTTILMMGAYASLNCIILFKTYSLVTALAPSLVTMFVAWAFVTLFRQLTAERDRRHFAKQLGQYTSPIIAAKIAESPAAAAAFKTVQTRDVTCFFSDLAGFTTISEREDAEVVQYVLNSYLKRMSETIWSKRGLINKFMGDGIMAFFNPSVDPLPEHPLAACETSLLVLEELEKLKAEEKEGPAASVFQQLDMRIGLASGTAKNGDLGSELKADYTVIGDVVNLAARLEPANKVFGTNIMISGRTYEQVKESFDCRYLAELQVKGKASTVPVYELVARKGQMSPEQKEYAQRFEEGVKLYKSGEWDKCIVHFTRMLTRRFDDPGPGRYIDACQELKQFPPENGWNGALELKEK